jgi:hypothetical protein
MGRSSTSSALPTDAQIRDLLVEGMDEQRPPEHWNSV